MRLVQTHGNAGKPKKPARGIQIGQLLIEQGVLTERQVDHIVKLQKISHRPFGDLAERIYAVDPKAIEDAWVEQYLRVAGTIDLKEQAVDADCLRLLNRRQAWQFQLLPMHRRGEQVAMATTADNLVRSVNFATRTFDEPVLFQIAERRQLREFLKKHYPVPSFMQTFAEKM